MKNQRMLFLVAGDIIAVIASFFLTLSIGFWGLATEPLINTHLVPFFLMYAIWIVVLFLFNLYDITSVKPTIPHLRRMGLALITCFILGIAFFYIVPIFNISPKTNLVINIVAFSILLFGWRRVFYAIFSAKFHSRVILISNQTTVLVTKLIDHIEKHPQSGFRLVSIYSDFANALASEDMNTIDLIITTENLPSTAKDLKTIYGSGVDVISLPAAYEAILNKIPVTEIDETWLLHHLHHTNKRNYEAVATVIGWIVSSVVLIATLPVSVIVSLAIKWYDRGPILIRQERVGKNGQVFPFLKFRSMIALDASGQAEQGKAVWASKNDPRITPVGRIIRKLHIDEIPQLINVLRGDMALVGPRPERPEFVEQLEKEIPYYHLRHIVKPGFTGWAQIKFRYARSIEDTQEKFEYDLYYIKNKNFFMDTGIILRTIQIIFTH